MKKYISCLISAFLILTSTGHVYAASQCKIHFINVGQADSTLIEYNGEYVLIDGGIVTQSGKNEADYTTNEVSIINQVTDEEGNSYLGYYDAYQRHTDYLRKNGTDSKPWQLSALEATARETITAFEADENNASFLEVHSELSDMYAYQSQGNASTYHKMQTYYIPFLTLSQTYQDLAAEPQEETTSTESSESSLETSQETTEIPTDAASEYDDEINALKKTLAEKESEKTTVEEKLAEAKKLAEEAQNTESVAENSEDGTGEETTSEETTETQTSQDDQIAALENQLTQLESDIASLQAQIKELEEKAAAQQTTDTTATSNSQQETTQESSTQEESSEEEISDTADPQDVVNYLYAVGYHYIYNLIIDYFKIDDNTTDSANDALRYLKRHGITHIDYMVCTHSHYDHVGGLPSILINLNVDHLIYNGVTYSTASYRVFERLMRDQEAKNTIDITVADDSSHNTFSIGNGAVTFTELTDTEPFSSQFYVEGHTNYEINNQSLVYRMDYKGVSTMFTADAEKDRQDQIMKDHEDLLDIDIYKAAHHGFNNYASGKYNYYGDKGHSANYDFVNAITPLYTIVSNGTRSSAVPSKNALADMVYSNVYVTTDQVNKVSHEAIIVTLDGSTITLTDPDGKTVAPHTGRTLSYSVTSSSGMPNQSNSTTSTATALHYASTKTSFYNDKVSKAVTVTATPNYYYPNVFYQLSANDTGYNNDSWISGNTAKLSGQFKGVVYFKFTNKFGETIIRKTDGYQVAEATVPKVASLNAELYGYDDVKLTWSNVSGASSYVLQYKREDWTSWKALATSKKTSLKHANLADGKGYYFRIKVSGESAYTTTSSMLYTLKKMAAPTVSKVTTTKTKVSYTALKGATGYQVSAYTSSKKKVVATTTATKAEVTVKKGKKYYYYVRAYKTVNGTKIYGPWSSVKKFTCK